MPVEINNLETVIQTKVWMLERGLTPIGIARQISPDKTSPRKIRNLRTIISRIINNHAHYPGYRKKIESAFKITLPVYVPSPNAAKKRLKGNDRGSLCQAA